MGVCVMFEHLTLLNVSKNIYLIMEPDNSMSRFVLSQLYPLSNNVPCALTIHLIVSYNLRLVFHISLIIRVLTDLLCRNLC
jgi:hypothetical protein